MQHSSLIASMLHTETLNQSNMDGMVINNLSAQATTECSMLQQELLKSFVETRKQKGITESLMKRLAVKKMNAIEDMYGTRTWFHGLNSQELKIEVYKHGKVVKFEPTK